MCYLKILFAFYTPCLDLEKLTNQKYQGTWHWGKGGLGKEPQQNPVRPSQRTKRSAAQQNRKVLDNKHSTAAKHCMKNYGPIHIYTSKAKWKARLHPHKAVTRHPTLPTKHGIKEVRVGNWDFHTY